MCQKTIEISGKLIVHDDVEHHEFLNKFYKFLKSENWHFKGTTKELDNTITFERMKRVD